MADLITHDDIDFGKYMRESEGAQRVRPASEWADDVIDHFYPQDQKPDGLLPWAKTHQQVQFRPGEVTLWFGMNGHGKSLLQGQCMTSLAAQGYRCCIASFEMKPNSTLHRMTRQALRHPQPSAQAVREFMRWTDGRVWLYDQQGTVQTETMLAVLRYCATELEIRHFAIDSLMKCVKGEDDFNGQKQFIDSVTAIARDSGMHIHLVHHARKSGDEGSVPGKMDARGAGSITDQVDNVLSVWRNKPKEEAAGSGRSDKADQPDTLLTCSKQRNGEWEGKIGLWFDRGSFQFLGAANAQPQDLTVFDDAAPSRWRRTA